MMMRIVPLPSKSSTFKVGSSRLSAQISSDDWRGTTPISFTTLIRVRFGLCSQQRHSDALI